MPDLAIAKETLANCLKIQQLVDDLAKRYKESDDLKVIAECKQSISSLNNIYYMNMQHAGFSTMRELKAWLDEQKLIE